MRIATGEIEDNPRDPALDYARKGGLKGGRARAKKLLRSAALLLESRQAPAGKSRNLTKNLIVGSCFLLSNERKKEEPELGLMNSVAEVAKCGRIIISPIEVQAVLDAMFGLSVHGIHKAIDSGEVDRNGCNELNPPTDAGHRAHGTTTRVMRELYVPKGWTPCDRANFSTLISPDASMEIAVASGDPATGNPDLTPQTQWKKGEVITLGVERNQLWLFSDLPLITSNKRPLSAATVWFLLRYRIREIVRCELSIPTKSLADKPEDLKRRIFFGGTRIILPDLEIRPRGDVKPRDEDMPSEHDVTVVRRKA